MKFRIAILVVFITTVLIQSAYAQTKPWPIDNHDDCEVVPVKTHVYLHRCPRGQVAVAAQVDHIGNFTYTYLACAKMELLCGQELERYNNELVFQQSIQSTTGN